MSGYCALLAESVMRRERGLQFDPEILDLFFDSFDEVMAIRDSANRPGADLTFSAEAVARLRP